MNKKYIIKYTDLGPDPVFVVEGNVMSKNVNRAKQFDTVEQLSAYAYKEVPAGYEIQEISV